MSTQNAVPLVDIATIEAAIDVPFQGWAHRCHEISLAIVKARVWPSSRVARGWCAGVRSQHSWVVHGWDCYDPEAWVLDPTLWSYDATVTGLWTGRASVRPHRPHGAGSIWEAGPPIPGNDPPIELVTPAGGWSREAMSFLFACGPLDRRGWMEVANGPMEGWPAAEIIAAMCETPQVAALIPIDIVGMLTDRNPQGAYLAGDPA